jgi:glycosyltransferase involved in cell wall biosynthesis
MNMDKEKTGNKACILSFYPGGGMLSMTKCFFNLLKELDYEVDVYYFAKFWECLKEKTTEFEGITYNKLPYFPILFISMLNYLFSSFFLGRFFSKYDLLLSISGSFHVSLPFVVQRRNHITNIATSYYEEHRSKFDFKKINFKKMPLTIELILFRWLGEFVERTLYKSKHNKAVLIDSEYTKALLREKYGLRDNAYVFPYWVNNNIFKPKVREDEEKYSDFSQQYIFSCGRFDDERKNITLLLDAFKLLKRENSSFKNLKLIIAGFKPSDSKKYYIKHHLDGSIVFLGYISDEEKVRYYQNASLFVLPSKQEGLGIVVLEAMACGVPVISTRCGGPESVIEHGVNGIFTEMDKKAMAEDIEKILTDINLAKELIRNGLTTVRKKFSKEAAMSVLEKAIAVTRQSEGAK